MTTLPHANSLALSCELENDTFLSQFSASGQVGRLETGRKNWELNEIHFKTENEEGSPKSWAVWSVKTMFQLKIHST